MTEEKGPAVLENEEKENTTKTHACECGESEKGQCSGGCSREEKEEGGCCGGGCCGA